MSEIFPESCINFCPTVNELQVRLRRMDKVIAENDETGLIIDITDESNSFARRLTPESQLQSLNIKLAGLSKLAVESSCLGPNSPEALSTNVNKCALRYDFEKII